MESLLKPSELFCTESNQYMFILPFLSEWACASLLLYEKIDFAPKKLNSLYEIEPPPPPRGKFLEESQHSIVKLLSTNEKDSVIQ